MSESAPPRENRSPGAPLSRIQLSAQVAAGSRLRIRVDAQNAAARSMGAAKTGSKVSRWAASLSLDMLLFGLAVFLYFATHFNGLEKFPIYFFSDEASQTVLAEDLVHNGFFGEDGDLLPTFFQNGGKYRLGFTVYLQILPYLLFSKSVFVTRATFVLFSSLGAIALGLTLRNIFKIPYWWGGVLLLAIAPAWFLHSRTAFEYATAVAFYALFLYFYLLYRYCHPGYLYLALLAGALAFYSYSPIQVVVLVSGLLLFLSDLAYHRQNRAMLWRGAALLVVLALPYLRFLLVHRDENLESLRALSSYWLMPIPLTQKIQLYLSKYLYGLSPLYWYVPNSHDIVRHVMKGYGHLHLLTLPFAVYGMVLTLKNMRSSAYRTLLIALVASPSGAALVDIGVTRALVLVVPATLLTALGLSMSLVRLEKYRLPRRLLSIALFVTLSLVSVFMTQDALVNGPTWFQDYGLYGMQYGAQQMTTAVSGFLDRTPNTSIIISPNWANGIIDLVRFFLPYEPPGQIGGTEQSLLEPLPIHIAGIEWYLSHHLPLNKDIIFVMTPQDYEKAVNSGIFMDIQVLKTIPYPNGEAGFYFVTLRYVDTIDQILPAEPESRSLPESGRTPLHG